jgi:two-component sensor histidine kinase
MTFWDSSITWLQDQFRRIGAKSTASNGEVETGSLRFRFQLVVGLALLPVAALSFWQGIERLRLDQEIVREALRQSALAAASDELNVFVAAEQVIRALANDPSIRAGATGCRSRMRDAIAGTKFLPNMLRVTAEGKYLCSAFGTDSGDTAVPHQAWWSDAKNSLNFTLSEPVFSQAVKHRVLYGVVPIFDENNVFDGSLGVAIDVDWLDYIQRQKLLPRGAVVALFEKSGRIVVSNNMDVATPVFSQGAKTPRGSDADGLLTATDRDGEAWSLAIAPLIRRDFYVGFSMKSSHLFRFTYVHVTVDLLLPVLMMVLASLAIWSVTDRVVVRSIDLLQRTATAYGKGHYAIRPAALKSAPREFRQLADSLSDMAQAVQERDRRLRDALDQKAVLIKEIHHRVKNSLQIVMSLLSLQASRLSDPAAREAIEQTRTRVNALALVHRMIYELDLDGTVDLKALLDDVVAQLQQGFGGDRRGITVHVEAQPYRTKADIAIPLTLFAVEAMTNAYKHGFDKSRRGGNIFVTLTPSGGQMKLTIRDDGQGVSLDNDTNELGTGARLMAAFANQIGGQVSMRRSEQGGTIVELDFPDGDRQMAATAAPARSQQAAD